MSDDLHGERLRPAAFGAWLLIQTDRDGWIGDLAKAAKADRGFPCDGDADAIRAHLSARQADADMLEALDDAEGIWLRE
ncbi:hypothetical protein [Sphingomonas sp. MMS24-J13]|uniref:hypothetical protein n=1 Tax=Sphingomonas sp. MMS24-J13 TaxID=3238686 RepID=UPI00384C0E46